MSEGFPTNNQEEVPNKSEGIIAVNPSVSLETLRTHPLHEISYDISKADEDQRKTIFERLSKEKDEKWASEALEIDQSFSVAEQEQLVSMISDPELSAEVLTLDESSGKKLMQEQKEKLMAQIESDESVAYLTHLNFTESGIEPNETEKWWLGRLEKILSKTSDPDIAAYTLENVASLTKAARKHLEKIV